jgi:hypothetical protein
VALSKFDCRYLIPLQRNMSSEICVFGSVHHYPHAARPKLFEDAVMRDSLGIRSGDSAASVILMLDSLHLFKVVEGDLAWP